MSVKISGQVWELDLDPIDKLVLLALADHADHEGNNIRPGNDLLCAKTGLSHQTISAKFKKFIEGGLLIPTNTFGRGRNREFMKLQARRTLRNGKVQFDRTKGAS